MPYLPSRLLLLAVLAVATTAMLGSLYFSEVSFFIPCKLCWYQRIAMYPIVIVALVGIIINHYQAAWYSLILALIGLPISIFHVLLQRQWLGVSADACSDSLCALIYVDYLGLFTIPSLAGIAFLMIAILSILCLAKAN